MYNLEKRENYLFILMFVFPYIYFIWSSSNKGGQYSEEIATTI